MSQLHLAFELSPINLIEKVPRSWTKWIVLELNLKKVLGRTFYKNVMTKESFFVASDVVPVLYNEPFVCIGD